jgi:hypothetical protein
MKPALIVLTCAFILFMLSGCVVAPYDPVVYAAPAHAHHQHHHHPGHRSHGRRGWR